MSPVRICDECELLVTTAVTAMRRHGEAMHDALCFVHAGITEELKDELKIDLIASFNNAQSTWDAYRSHLREHGILPVIP